MPRSGTGTYTLPAPPSPFQDGQTISAPDMMTVMNDIATALTASTAADGQTPITGNWNFGGKNISNVGTLAATAAAFGAASTSGGMTVGNGLVVTTGGATITGNSTVTGTVTITVAGTSGNQAVNYSQFPATLASPGTTTLPNGLIVKWGTGSTTLGVGSVTFAAAFPTACFNVQLTPSGATGTLTIRPLALGAFNASGFDVWGDATESFGFNWVAIGH